MISVIVSLPVMLILSVIQSVAVSRISIMSGSADIILLAIVSLGVTKENRNIFIWALVGGIFISFISAMPAVAVITAYLVVAGITRFVYKGIWQSPILAILLSSFIGTVVKFIIDIIALQFISISIDFPAAIRMTLAPNLILNLFILFPIYSLMGDLSKWISRKEEYEG
jgi:hypothetical protein